MVAPYRMKFLCYIERINQMNKLLQTSNTGSPSEFAGKLGVSRTRLYEMIDELRSYGAPIAYNRSIRTFYYREPFDISVQLFISPLETVDQKNTRGGTKTTLPFFYSGRRSVIFTLRKQVLLK